VNSFFGVPLLAGIFTDSIGVINMLPIYDLLLIVGQIIVYFSFNNGRNEPMALVGLFFTCFSYGLKDTSRLVYVANTFITKRDNEYDIREFSTQNVIILASRYAILALVAFFSFEEICSTNIATLTLICLGFSVIGLLASIGLNIINKIEVQEQRKYKMENGLNSVDEGNIFVEYNNRMDQNEDETPTLTHVFRKLFKEANMGYVKFWLFGAACLMTLSTLYITKRLYVTVPYLFPSLQLILTLALIWVLTEKRMRFLTMFSALFFIVFQIYSFFQTDFVEWVMVVALPVALLFTDIYMPFAFDFDLSYLGITIGVKKCFENFLLLFASITHSMMSEDAYKFYQLGLAVAGFCLVLIYNESYLKHKSLASVSERVPLLNSSDSKLEVVRS